MNLSFRVLLNGGDEEKPASKTDMETKQISFNDFLPMLWQISQQPDPGTMDDFYEGLKVNNRKFTGSEFC